VPVNAGLRARVRTRELVYADGTTNLSANAVLNKTGDDALNAAVEIARSGNWSAPPARPRFNYPPAIVFDDGYPNQSPYPAVGYRLLAAARIWGIMHFFHPYKYLYDHDWDAVFAEYLPKMAAARNAREYHLAVAQMTAYIDDSHRAIFGSSELTDYWGGNTVPSVEIRWIENQPVITRILNPALEGTLHLGDVVTKIDDQPVQKRIDDLSRTIAASTPQALMDTVTHSLLSVDGTDRTFATVTVRNADGADREFEIRRQLNTRNQSDSPSRSGQIFRLISPKIGYVDLERVTNDQVDAMFERFKDTDGIILDMRGYPQGTAPEIVSHLAVRPPTVSQVRIPIVAANPFYSNAGNLSWSGWIDQKLFTYDRPPYSGKTVMLIDERAISQSEFSGMAFRAANGTIFIGSPTKGANGPVTGVAVPGGMYITFSGADSRWPDGKQNQRVGLQPDVEVRPTIAGIRAGRDEILDRAIAYLEQGR